MILTPVAVASALAATVAPTATQPAPPQYTVVAGDTVSGICDRFGLDTSAVLAANGLGWSSLIFPGQVLQLAAPAPAAAPAPVPAPQPAPAPAPAATRTVVAGDTIWAIADAAGVPVQAVLDANGLGWDSLIYPGQVLIVPAAAPATASAPAPVASAAPVTTAEPTAQQVVDTVLAGGIAELNSEMRANASTIIQVGRSLGVSDQGIVIALAAAAQESVLRNVDYGDRDSLGLFQQRPSTGWGTPDEVRDPVRASYAFFGGPSNPNAGRTRGLLDIPGWEHLTVTQAAQAVQISAYPDAYAKWEPSARAWLTALG